MRSRLLALVALLATGLLHVASCGGGSSSSGTSSTSSPSGGVGGTGTGVGGTGTGGGGGGGQCKQGGEPCASSSDCCQGSCENGLCHACSQTGGPCSTSDQCCAGTCSNGVCGGTTCSPDGAPCAWDEECCAGTCGFDGYCGGDKCLPDGTFCDYSFQCCGYRCYQGNCLDGCNNATCHEWLDLGYEYADLCDPNKGLADAVINCRCSACASVCDMETCRIYYHTLEEIPSGACFSCLTSAGKCVAEETACSNDK